MSALWRWRAEVGVNPSTASVFHSPPDWSPDGSELAYVVYENVDSRLEPWLEINSIGTRQTRRARLPGTNVTRLDVSWSPDGKFVAYLDSGSQYENDNASCRECD
jgi:Tol biopolymer transport system component